MSIESSWPNSNPFDAEDGYDITAIMGDIRSEVDEKISDLLARLPDDVQRGGDTLYQLTLRAHVARLQELCDSFIGLASLADSSWWQISLDRTTPSMKAAHAPFVSEEAAQEALMCGMTNGTEDFLTLLVPDEALMRCHTEEGKRHVHEVYFTRWRIDTFEHAHPDCLAEEENGQRAYLPTRVPDVHIEYFYPPDESFPQRYIAY